ncbi:MAG: hypothetical protein ABSG53_29130 [Thermoguttaceae bacterium]|jgi:hypothetical protein
MCAVAVAIRRGVTVAITMAIAVGHRVAVAPGGNLGLLFAGQFVLHGLPREMERNAIIADG